MGRCSAVSWAPGAHWDVGTRHLFPQLVDVAPLFLTSLLPVLSSSACFFLPSAVPASSTSDSIPCSLFLLTSTAGHLLMGSMSTEEASWFSDSPHLTL